MGNGKDHGSCVQFCRRTAEYGFYLAVPHHPYTNLEKCPDPSFYRDRKADTGGIIRCILRSDGRGVEVFRLHGTGL